MTQQFNESIEVVDSNQTPRATISRSGQVNLRDSRGSQRVDLRGTSGQLFLRDSNGKARAFIGGDGKIRMWDSSQTERITISNNTLRFRDSGGELRVDIKGTNGQLCLRDSGGERRVDARGASGQLYLRDSNGNARAFVGGDGKIRLWDSSRKERVTISESGQIFLRDANGTARAFVGGDGKIRMWNSSQKETITIDGDAGDIRLRGADCAEHFDVAAEAAAGTVLVMDRSGELTPCREAYDRRVVGVVSGAGDYRPGLILDDRGDRNGRVPVALVGKVVCCVDASRHPIGIGDLLTTSTTPGHAMKATNAARAFGSVLGKAMRAQPAGQGEIPILVCLQ